MTFENIKSKHNDNIMPSYSRFDVALVSGKGAIAVDCDGKEYIDFTSGIGVNSLGYCDDKWVSAVSQQAATLQHTSNLYYNPMPTQLAAKLCELTGFDKVFFGNSGAEANECAIKLARKYSNDKYGEDRNEIVALQNSFHGRTVTTLSATGQDHFHEHFAPFTGGFSFAETNLGSVKNAVNDKTCAVLIELIQGEGGVCPLDKTFVKELSAFCAQKDILLLVDEVQTGVGRTGAFYCYQNYDIMPDVITSAKGLGGGLPIGACLCRKGLGEVLSSGMHGSTFGGNPVVCAGALAVLDRVAQPEFLTEVQAKSEYICKKLSKMKNVDFVRGMGLMIGIALKKGSSKEAAAVCAKNGLLILTAKELLRMLPPLTISYEEIDKGLAILEQVID